MLFTIFLCLLIWTAFGGFRIYTLYQYALSVEQKLISYHEQEQSVQSMKLSAQYMLLRANLIEMNQSHFQMLEERRTRPVRFFVTSFLTSLLMGPILYFFD